MKERELARRLRTLSEPEAPPELGPRLEATIPASCGRPRNVRIARGAWALGKWGIVVGAPAALAIWMIGTFVLGPSAPVAFAAVLEPVVRGTADARAVHFVLHRLTREGEDFSFVDLEGKGLTVDVRVEAPRDEPGRARFRMEKPDRILTFDGRQGVLYMKRGNEALRWEGPSPIASAYWPANWIRELRDRPGQNVDQVLYEEKEGIARLVYREHGVDTSPLPKAFLGDFDRETELRWTLDTHLLTGVKIWIDTAGERRLYSELLSIDYLPEADPESFRIDLPADVRFVEVRKGTPEENALGPAEVARGLFEAAQRKDRSFLELYCPSPAVVDWALAQPPFEILYVGEPFRSGRYVGVFVPYRIRIEGKVKEWQVALRNDNPERRWVFDGGI